jgi:integrase
MRVQLKGVLHVRKKLADGEVRDYWYAWRGGPRLEGHPGASEFIASYNVAVASRKRPSNKDLSSLLDAYQDSEARQGDLLRLTWKAYDGQFIRLRQSKTDVHVTVPVGKPLKAILDTTSRLSPFIIASEDDRPYTSDGFRASWRKTCDRAGVKGLTFHDLRGTAVSRLAGAGATEMEIAAITGHAVGDVRSIMDKCYFNRDPAMALRAMQKLEKGTKSANRPANRPE